MDSEVEKTVPFSSVPMKQFRIQFGEMTPIQSYAPELLMEPITYIVSAVWGSDKKNKVTTSQKEINRIIAPLLKEIVSLFEFHELSSAQAFAFGYLIRGLLISKIVYMVSQLKNQGLIEHEFDNISKTLLN